ncbi:MAG: leucine-rich repeat protein, partial [Treponema sp.]|nr:leucine-rich repeat protein [Treponema sp.]
PTVTSVTISPATPNVVKGGTQQFTATVSGTNNPAQTVTWTVEGGGNGTSINSSGLLSVGADETASTLTVRAASTVDTSKSGTTTVTVSGGGQTPTVTSVTISPATAAVVKGGTQQFTAAVSGTNSPVQTVTWTVEGGGDGTSISTAGLLSVAANESASTLTVRADSTVDPSKFGTASVMVQDEAFRDIASIHAYLSAASGGATVSLPVQLNLADTSNGWAALLNAIQTADKFVALDLSASTLSGAEYDPGTAYTGKGKIVSLVLPDTATSIKAGSWEDPTFKNFTTLTSVSGSAVETIGAYAFYRCTSLTELNLPAATDIGESAFSGCAALTTVSLPAATSSGDYAFHSYTALTTVSIPAASSIGNWAFAYCDALTTVSLPATLITISSNPFSGCRNLATITVASGNPNYSAQGGMLLNKAGTTLIAYPSATGAVTLNTVTSIGGDAFAYCTALTTVSLPAATDIGDYAFDGCDALTTVSLPAATSIGGRAFYSCDALAEVSLPAATSIGDYAFRYCTSLTTVSLPAAASIGDRAFYGCTSLITVTLGSAAPTLGYGMFDGIYDAKTVTVTVPSGATGYGSLPATYSGLDSTVTWGNGFRGMGWDGAAFSTDTFNSYITVTIQAE